MWLACNRDLIADSNWHLKRALSFFLWNFVPHFLNYLWCSHMNQYLGIFIQKLVKWMVLCLKHSGVWWCLEKPFLAISKYCSLLSCRGARVGPMDWLTTGCQKSVLWRKWVTCYLTRLFNKRLLKCYVAIPIPLSFSTVLNQTPCTILFKFVMVTSREPT